MISPIDRFLKFVFPEPNTGCWVWGGYLWKSGYGCFRLDPKSTSKLAHRASYTLFKGNIPEGLEINHLCHNKWCVNPDHLEAVTHLSNIRYRDSWGRASRGDRWKEAHKGTSPKGVNHHNSKLTEEDVLTIRKTEGSSKEVAKRFKVSPSLIRMIRRGLGWNHI